MRLEEGDIIVSRTGEIIMFSRRMGGKGIL
jgi:hypothetical protein